jgi:hypothetical protein
MSWFWLSTPAVSDIDPPRGPVAVIGMGLR